MILIRDINASYIFIESDVTEHLDIISEQFSFYADGYRFMPLYKNGYWDGKIRLLNEDQTMYRHLAERVMEFCDEESIDYKDMRSKKGIVVEHDMVLKMIDSIPLTGIDTDPETGKKTVIDIKAREYQIDTISKCLTNDCGTILSPTASGKSLSIYLVVRFHLAMLAKHPEKKILLIVPYVSLVKQLFGDFKEYSHSNGFDTERYCHMIKASAPKVSDKQVYISTWQSLQRQEPEYFQQFDTLIIDEVHTASAKSIKGIAEKAVNAYNRYGFTGTLQDSKCNELIITGLMGNATKVISMKELMDADFVSQLKIRCIALNYPDYICKACTKVKYINEIEFIVQNQKRNKFICNLAGQTEGNTLVMFQLVEKHGIPLFEMMKDTLDNKKKVLYISGKTTPDKREEIRNLMETRSDIVLCASYGTFSTGVNVKNISNIIFASPYKSKIKVLQTIGRVLRKIRNNNSCALLFDVVDNMKWKKRQNYTFKHFLQRFEYYREEKFDVEMSEYEIR